VANIYKICPTTRFSQRLGQFGGFGNWRIFEGNAKRKGTAL